MAALTEDGVWLPTDVCAPTASLGLSVREVTGARAAVLSISPHSSHLTLPLCSTFTTHSRSSVFFFHTCCRCEHVTRCWMAVVFCDWRRLLLSHANGSRNVVCCGTFACWAWAQKWPLFSTSALKRCSGECNVFLNVHCLLTEDLPTSCGCSLAHVRKGSKVYKHTQTEGCLRCDCEWNVRVCRRMCGLHVCVWGLWRW